MNREKVRNTRHKSPKFRESYDEDLGWQDKMEIRYLRRKLNRKMQRRRNEFEKW